MNQQLDLEKITCEVLKKLEARTNEPTTPVGISNRHIHLSSTDLEALFGSGYELTKWKDLKQPGQFAAKETVTIVGPKGTLSNVRILGPVRGATQVEVSSTDSYQIGIKVPVRESGKIDGTPGFLIMGPKGILEKKEGMIVALRHIHMPPTYAEQFGFKDKEMVRVQFEGDRSLTFDQVLLRVSDKYVLEMHIDTDEANAAGVKNGTIGKILKGDS